MSISVVFEDNHLVIVNKPAGLATMGTSPTEPSLAREVQSYLKQKYNKPGNVYLGVVSRLDSVTSGLVVFAKTSKAAARLTNQFRERAVVKWYLAAVPSVHSRWLEQRRALPESAWFDAAQISWHDIVWKDDSAQRMRIRPAAIPTEPLGNLSKFDETGKDGQMAQLTWRLLGRGPAYDLVLVRLLTGRKHQIRVQFAERGFPVLGDRKYGSRTAFGQGIALHSWRLELVHPVAKTKLSFFQEPPQAWSGLDAVHVESDVPCDGKFEIRPLALCRFLKNHMLPDSIG